MCLILLAIQALPALSRHIFLSRLVSVLVSAKSMQQVLKK
jgi:hypothetical protein